MSYPSANNTNINSDLFANLVTQSQFAAYENSIARALVTTFDAPLNTGLNLQVPVWGSVSAQLIADEAAASARNTGSDSATITLKEHVVYHQVTDMLRDSAYSNVMTVLGDQSGRAIAESMDTQVFSTFSDLSSDLGSTSTELTVDLILQAAATLRGRKLTGPFYAVVHPAAAYNLKKQLTSYIAYSGAAATPSNLSDIGNNVLGNFYIGSVAGVSIFESALVASVTTGGATAARNAVFHPGALGHAMRGTIEMNTLYLPANRATDVVLKAVAGAAAIQTGFGVAITTDARIN
jgi:hypothetical protein